ncbi:MBOAT family protein [Chryseolinea sp. T2]|uniref:MBOAT family O-acyltransferase n=1 Tax=Chryseolinea sp. T2 TaxID=3129255 RepID=UPI0030781727
MLFSSLVFLTLFLPIVLFIYFLLGQRYRNLFLFLASIFFYAWGEPSLTIIMLISIMINFVAGRAVVRARKQYSPVITKLILAVAVTVNLGLLIYYKYFNFLLGNLHELSFFTSIDNDSVLLPVGISFYTFHSISYLMDLYWGNAEELKNPVDLGLYIALFPQLIAGPIVRYHDIDQQIRSRSVTSQLFVEGIHRFIQGLGKKVLIANTMALVADNTFSVSPEQLPVLVAWTGIICYTLQIYFDFSGYSDMAVGLGKMFGFTLPENFNFPYIAQSIQEFWRRWHLSLSSWFRDYLYIPMGGSRGGTVSTYRNLIIVFFVTGLWHGASWNFVIWGLYHGFFLILERIGLGKFLLRIPAFFRTTYCILIVMIGWVFFRSDDLTYSIGFLQTLFTGSAGTELAPMLYYNNYFWFMLALGIVFSTPVMDFIQKRLTFLQGVRWERTIDVLKPVGYILVLVFCFMELAQNSYNPFIYFRF